MGAILYVLCQDKTVEIFQISLFILQYYTHGGAERDAPN